MEQQRRSRIRRTRTQKKKNQKKRERNKKEKKNKKKKKKKATWLGLSRSGPKSVTLSLGLSRSGPKSAGPKSAMLPWASLGLPGPPWACPSPSPLFFFCFFFFFFFFFFLFFFFFRCSKTDFLGPNWLSISRLSSFVKNHFLGSSRGVPLRALFSFFSFFLFFFVFLFFFAKACAIGCCGNLGGWGVCKSATQRARQAMPAQIFVERLLDPKPSTLNPKPPPFDLQQTFMWSIAGLRPAMIHMKAC